MVEYAIKFGVAPAAREFKTTRKTVYKWLRRYKQYGLEGLNDRKRIPKHIPHKMPPEEEERIKLLRRKHPSWGARKLKAIYNLKYSQQAIHRVIKQNGLVRKRKKKYRKKRSLVEVKLKYKAFEYAQIDVKQLQDIPQYWPYMKRLKLPKYQYTFRELSSGAVFYAYSDENNSLSARIFAEYVIEHLANYNICVKNIQTDNGSEFIGSVNKKVEKKSLFEEYLDKREINYLRIPPRKPNYNSDVETFHKIIEDEFYECEKYERPLQFFARSYSYQIFFNYFRPNINRHNKSPAEILREKGLSKEVEAGLLSLPPIKLEWLINEMNIPEESVYHLPWPPGN
jgi:transposase